MTQLLFWQVEKLQAKKISNLPDNRLTQFILRRGTEYIFPSCWLWQLYGSLPCGSCGLSLAMIYSLPAIGQYCRNWWMRMRMKDIFNLVGYGNYTYHCHLVVGNQSTFFCCARQRPVHILVVFCTSWYDGRWHHYNTTLRNHSFM